MSGDTRPIAYTRVSTEERSANDAGLGAQESVIRAEIERRHWQLVDLVTEVASGKRADTRERLQAVLDRLAAGDANVLVVSRLDRLTRSLLDFSAVVERAQRERWRLVVVEQAFDLGTSSGRTMAGMLAVFAQFERDLISERIKEALAVKRSQGVRLGRPPVLDPQLRRRIRGLRTRGWSYRAIADVLNNEQVPTGHAGVSWWPMTVKRVIEQGGWEPRRRG